MNTKNIARKFPVFFPHFKDKKNTPLKIRSDSRTPLGKTSLFDQGSTSVKDLKKSATF